MKSYQYWKKWPEEWALALTDGPLNSLFIFRISWLLSFTKMVEESHCLSWVSGAINASYSSPAFPRLPILSPSDYHPISLCNTIYKLISKPLLTGSNHPCPSTYLWTIWPFRAMSNTWCYSNRSRVCLHSIKTSYLMVLHKIGIGPKMINRIKACIKSAYWSTTTVRKIFLPSVQKIFRSSWERPLICMQKSWHAHI